MTKKHESHNKTMGNRVRVTQCCHSPDYKISWNSAAYDRSGRGAYEHRCRECGRICDLVYRQMDIELDSEEKKTA